MDDKKTREVMRSTGGAVTTPKGENRQNCYLQDEWAYTGWVRKV